MRLRKSNAEQLSSQARGPTRLVLGLAAPAIFTSSSVRNAEGVLLAPNGVSPCWNTDWLTLPLGGTVRAPAHRSGLTLGSLAGWSLKRKGPDAHDEAPKRQKVYSL